MNDMIAQMINGYLIAFDSYQIKNDSLQKEVDDFKEKLTGFADRFSDVVAFSTEFSGSGLAEEYTALISKVAMADYAPSENESASDVISVKAFVEQYRASYDEIIKSKYRKRGKAAYEKIFAVAEKTDDMLDAQIMLEQERLLWKIVPEDALDIFETTLEAMDPVWQATTETLIKNIEAYKKAASEEQLVYLLDLAEFDREPVIKNNIIRIFVAILFGKHLLVFNSCKMTVYEWPNDNGVKSAIMGMISSRECLRRALPLLKRHFGMTFDDILKKDEMKIWPLLPHAIDGLGRIKTALHPQNLDVLKDIIDNEIVPDISIYEILMRKPKSMLWLDLDGAKEKEFVLKSEKRAEELNAHLLYHQFKNELSTHSAGVVENVKNQQNIATHKMINPQISL